MWDRLSPSVRSRLFPLRRTLIKKKLFVEWYNRKYGLFNCMLPFIGTFVVLTIYGLGVMDTQKSHQHTRAANVGLTEMKKEEEKRIMEHFFKETEERVSRLEGEN
eukprot:GHVN01074920.1.p2 GENE.GHVN01074920.1~~GHVN01074920.1.p2  ORF type:complete len:105 (+),score=23.93 GHVN01074920.1:154-468(+)